MLSFTIKEIAEANMLLATPNRIMTDDEYSVYKLRFEVMGGHWRESMKGFVFYLDQLQRTSQEHINELHQFYPTPQAVAEMVAEASGLDRVDVLENIRILEPSAGTGALLKELPTRLLFAVTVVEPDKRHWLLLRGLAPDVRTVTFEEYYESAKADKDTYSHVIMNPPYSSGCDISHVYMAYDLLRPNGRLVAVLSENVLYYDNETNREFYSWLKEHGAEITQLPHGVFKESGTTIDTILVSMNKT